MSDSKDFVQFTFKWNCASKRLVEFCKYKENIYSEPFLTIHNGVYMKWKLMMEINDKDCVGLFVKLVDGLTTCTMGPSPECLLRGSKDRRRDRNMMTCAKVLLGPISYLKDGNDVACILKTKFLTDYYELEMGGIGWGYPNLIKLVKIAGHYELPFDFKDVIFYFTLRVLSSSFKSGLSKPLLPTSHATVLTMYETTRLVTRSPTVDFTLVSKEGVQVHAHKGFLSAISEVFEGLFNSELDKDVKKDKIALDQFETVALKELVNFAYLNAPSADIKDNVEVTLKAAHYYMVKTLVNECERVIAEKLLENKISKCVQYYCLAKLYDLKVVENMATCILLDMWTELGVSTSDQLKPYLPELTETLLQFSRSHFCVLHSN